MDNCRIVIYGAGKTAEGFLKNINKDAIVTAIVDSDEKKCGNVILGGVEVTNPRILAQKEAYDYVVVCSVYAEEIIEKIIKDYSVELRKIIVANPGYYDSPDEFFATDYVNVFSIDGAGIMAGEIAGRAAKYDYWSKIDRAEAFDILLKESGLKIDLMNPETFNDKIRYMEKSHYSDLVVKCTDKYEVRKYVKYCGFEDILVPLLGGPYESYDAIDINICKDEKTMLKCTHSCGANIAVNKDTNREYAEYFINKKLKQDISKWFQEWHYESIKPRIICEKYLADGENERLIDYKYFCCNGKINCILACTERDERGDSRHMYYDEKWRVLDYAADEIKASHTIPAPKALQQMNKIARKLSEPFPFARVDLYDLNGKVYFGELTFTPMGGLISDKVQTKEAQMILGSCIDVDYGRDLQREICEKVYGVSK